MRFSARLVVCPGTAVVPQSILAGADEVIE
jgi:hypothetical protein